MPFKPNYKQERSDRNRTKAQKKQEKLQRREEDSAKRKAARETGQPSQDATDDDQIEKD